MRKVYFLLFFIFLECENKNYIRYYDYIKELYGDKDVPGDKVFVIIPTTGCMSCISPAIAFLKKNIHSPVYEFIITEITDRKYLKSMLGEEIYLSERLIFDQKNIWRKYNIYDIYPLIVFVRNNEITKVLYVDIKIKNVWNEI